MHRRPASMPGTVAAGVRAPPSSAAAARHAARRPGGSNHAIPRYRCQHAPPSRCWREVAPRPLPMPSSRLAALVSARVDFDFAAACYVVGLCSDWCGDGACNVAAALSSHALKLFRHGGADLQHAADLAGHTDRVADVYMPAVPGNDAVVSASDDGSVRVWDLRSRSHERCAAGARTCVLKRRPRVSPCWRLYN